MRADDANENQVAILGDLDPVDEDFRRLLARLVRRERREILHADERARRVPHLREIQTILDPPDIRFEERRLPPRDLVQVAPEHGVVASVELVGHLVDRSDVDIGGQRIVESHPERSRSEIGVQLEVRHLRQRVHASVGAAGAVQLELTPPRHRPDRAIDFTLHRPRVLLDLPAAVPRAGVFDQELETGHGGNW